jgi:hypothetical protein
MENIELSKIKKEIEKLEKNKTHNIHKISNEIDLNKKCLLMRFYMNSQSGGRIFENIFIKHFNFTSTKSDIGDIIDNHGNICELKYSGFTKIRNNIIKFNYVQLRPHQHNIISYYYLCAYNLYENDFGELYIFKLPSKIIEKLIIKHGTYAHGKKIDNGIISKKNFKKHEYALRPSYGNKLWKILTKYKI